MRRISAQSLLFVPALALLASCVHGGPATSGAADADGCTSDNFNAFVARFAEDSAFQERHTADPLRREHVVNEGAREPYPVEEDVPRAKLKFPLFPSAAERKKRGLEVGAVEPNGNRMTVSVGKPDSDDVQVFFFEKNRCWTLVRHENLSL